MEGLDAEGDGSEGGMGGKGRQRRGMEGEDNKEDKGVNESKTRNGNKEGRK